MATCTPPASRCALPHSTPITSAAQPGSTYAAYTRSRRWVGSCKGTGRPPCRTLAPHLMPSPLTHKIARSSDLVWVSVRKTATFLLPRQILAVRERRSVVSTSSSWLQPAPIREEPPTTKTWQATHASKQPSAPPSTALPPRNAKGQPPLTRRRCRGRRSHHARARARAQGRRCARSAPCT